MASDPDNQQVLTTLPSGEPVDSSAPPPSLPPPSNNKASSLGALLAAAPSRTDAFISHLYRCMQTRAGADTVLLFLCYSTRLTGSVLETLSRPLLQHSARRLVALAFKLPPATTVVLASAKPQPPLAALAFRIGGYFKAAAALLSETRTMGRLWGLLGIYFAAKRLVLKTRAKQKRDPSEKAVETAAADAGEDLFDTLVAYAQVISLIVYQACENVAYLSSKKVLPFSPKTQGRLAGISVRSWGAYVGMELGRLLVERSRKVSSGVAAKDTKWAADWTRDFTRNLAWAPLTVHWSMEKGPLPDLAVSLLAAYPSVGAMRDLWRDTA
ncbi:peroxin 11C [Purpureocillium lavendulum]|uniref:Peroxin 11C n=1 Tax=Purpureocillium lavendulum TaxID=1247861 RepID=A0AB34FHA0_9HYPO|nr:peroxin 11C [Purpureocillium lavendulum]